MTKEKAIIDMVVDWLDNNIDDNKISQNEIFFDSYELKEKIKLGLDSETTIKQINELPESEWLRMKEHMDKKFPNMAMPSMDTFKEMVKLFGMSMEKDEEKGV